MHIETSKPTPAFQPSPKATVDADGHPSDGGEFKRSPPWEGWMEQGDRRGGFLQHDLWHRNKVCRAGQTESDEAGDGGRVGAAPKDNPVARRVSSVGLPVVPLVDRVTFA